MDGGFENSRINLHKEFIFKENIIQLFKKYKVPKTFDLLSVDIDGNDFHVLQSIIKFYKPRVIIVETNFNIIEPITIKYRPFHRWDGTCVGSASVNAFKRMLHDYHHAASLPPDTYWIRNDIRTDYVPANISKNRCALRHSSDLWTFVSRQLKRNPFRHERATV
jgi:hypothetical protein